DYSGPNASHTVTFAGGQSTAEIPIDASTGDGQDGTLLEDVWYPIYYEHVDVTLAPGSAYELIADQVTGSVGISDTDVNVEFGYPGSPSNWVWINKYVPPVANGEDGYILFERHDVLTGGSNYLNVSTYYGGPVAQIGQDFTIPDIVPHPVWGTQLIVFPAGSNFLKVPIHAMANPTHPDWPISFRLNMSWGGDPNPYEAADEMWMWIGPCDDHVFIDIYKITIDLAIDGTTEGTEETPGAFVLMNDNRDEGNTAGGTTPVGGTQAAVQTPRGDNEPQQGTGHRIVENDLQLKNGSIIVGQAPATTPPITGTLSWTIPEHIKVWWQETDANGVTKWVQVHDVSNYAAGTTKSLKIEGIKSGSDKITVTFTPGGSNTTGAATDEAKVTVKPNVWLETKEAIAQEPGKTGVFRVRRSPIDTASDITVSYSVNALTSTASPTDDYDSLPGTVVIHAGDSYADIVIKTKNDTTLED